MKKTQQPLTLRCSFAEDGEDLRELLLESFRLFLRRSLGTL